MAGRQPCRGHGRGADAGDPRFSLELRAQIAKALPGDPFFKIEGIAATSDQLLLGVREVGKDFKTASYTVKILALGTPSMSPGRCS